LGFWERTMSHVPLTGKLGMGNAELREALFATRKLGAINKLTAFGVDAGTAMTVSMGVRAPKEIYNYSTGQKTGEQAIKSYVTGVGTDSLAGGLIGLPARWGL